MPLVEFKRDIKWQRSASEEDSAKAGEKRDVSESDMAVLVAARAVLVDEGVKFDPASEDKAQAESAPKVKARRRKRSKE